MPVREEELLPKQHRLRRPVGVKQAAIQLPGDGEHRQRNADRVVLDASEPPAVKEPQHAQRGDERRAELPRENARRSRDRGRRPRGPRHHSQGPRVEPERDDQSHQKGNIRLKCQAHPKEQGRRSQAKRGEIGRSSAQAVLAGQRPKRHQPNHGQRDGRQSQRHVGVAQHQTERGTPQCLKRHVGRHPVVELVMAGPQQVPHGRGVGPVVKHRAFAERIHGRDRRQIHADHQAQSGPAGQAGIGLSGDGRWSRGSAHHFAPLLDLAGGAGGTCGVAGATREGTAASLRTRRTA